MSGMLPSLTELSPESDPDPRLIGLESEDAADLLSALASDTARELFCALSDEPATPSALADRVDTSLQNAQYHLEKLEAADLIEEIGTQYSEKGREMSVYAPANGPLVVYPGEEDEDTQRRLLRRLVGGLAIVGLLAVVLEAAVRRWLPTDDATEQPGGDVGPAIAAEPQPPAEEGHWLVEFLTELPPGLAFFLGGTLVLLIGLAIWYRRRVLIR